MNQAQNHNSTKRLSLIITAILLLSMTLFSGCAIIEDVVETATMPEPTAEDTFLSIPELNKAMNEAMMNGETEMTFNVANITEDELAHIAKNMSPFWGVPESYTINREFHEVENIIPGEHVNVKHVTSKFDLSDNYFVVKNIRDGEPIPSTEPNAIALAAAAPSVTGEAFTGAGETPYDKALALHNWLVTNLTYDETVEDIGPQNGSYGALINRRTMCQGYAEAMQLLLTCYTDIENEIIIGTAQSEPNAEWVGHAWNMINIDGQYYHIDITFDDPQNNDSVGISHFYFAQNDLVMQTNHHWEAEFFPSAKGEAFHYFINAGLFVQSMLDFEAVVTNAVTDRTPETIEIAATDITVDEAALQFVFKANESINEIHWTAIPYNTVMIYSIEPKYIG